MSRRATATSLLLALAAGCGSSALAAAEPPPASVATCLESPPPDTPEPTNGPPVSAPFEAITRFDAPALRRLPRPADPWSVLRDVPGIVVDRVNVGGSESEQQSLLLSKGDPGIGATWSLDGLDLTDPAALGTTLAYPDMDAVAAVEARTSSVDARVRTSGVQVRLLWPGRNTGATGALHLRGSWSGLQSQNRPEALAGRPFFRATTERVSEVGGSLGGPLPGTRVWGWAAVFRNALDQETFTEHDESLRTGGVTAKVEAPLKGGALTFRGLYADKRHEDRDSVLQAAPDARWRQSGPTFAVAVEDRRAVRGVSLQSRLSYVDGGFRLEPQGGSSSSALEDYRGVLQRSANRLDTDRARFEASIAGSSRARALGADHALAAGLAFSEAPVETRQSWPGNGTLGLERRSVFFQTFRLTGFAIPYRESVSRSVVRGAALHLSDELRVSRYTAFLGLRLERLAGRSKPSSVRANPEFPDLLPAAAYDGGGTGVTWFDLLPRVAVSAAFGSSMSAGLGYAAYAAPLGVAESAFDDPFREPASVTYYWKDANVDGTVQRGELDLRRGRLGASGVDPSRPGVAVSPNAIDPDLRAPRTHELFAAGELRLGDASVRGRLTWRRLDQALWRPLRNLTRADYAARGSVDGRLFDENYEVVYFAPASTSQIVPGNGRILSNRAGYAVDAWGAEVDAGGSLGATFDWRLWAAATFSEERFFDRALAVQDPTPLDTDPLVEGGLPVVRPGGLGRGDLFVGARIGGGAAFHVHLPAGLEASGLVHLREGFPVPYYEVASTGDPTAGSKNVLVSGRLDRYRLPGLVLVDLRLARGFGLGRGRLTVGLDIWNALNTSTTLQVARDVDLPAFNRPREIVRPRLLRLGLDWRF